MNVKKNPWMMEKERGKNVKEIVYFLFECFANPCHRCGAHLNKCIHSGCQFTWWMCHNFAAAWMKIGIFSLTKFMAGFQESYVNRTAIHLIFKLTWLNCFRMGFSSETAATILRIDLNVCQEPHASYVRILSM